MRIRSKKAELNNVKVRQKGSACKIGDEERKVSGEISIKKKPSTSH